ncbi:hypothetical protein CMO89_03920 [Candidatus Woesearchaeota archaeon]|nr:hypothetical protein [Candidatus Woesearchaeota archaeon]|tara:strand:- start:34 stop:1248 length:1215 start_codon:yes stop_codon:yes gene_type:complete
MLFLEFLTAIMLGISFGIITGLIPGIHVNLISIILLGLSSYLLGFVSAITVCIFIVAMAITHTFLDALPSIFLGSPDPGTALSVLPGHALLLRGMGYEAVRLTVIGSFLSLLVTLLCIPFLIPVVPKIYGFIQPYIGYILIAVVVYVILTGKTKEKIFYSSFVFILSGILGQIVFGIPNIKQPLFPMLSGMFGVSILLISLSNKVDIPKQRVTEMIKVSKLNKIKAIGAAVFSGSLTALFPGLGAAQAAIIAMAIVGKIGTYSFLILIGGINTVNFLFSLVTLYTLNKARNGAVVAVLEIVKSISLSELLVLLCAALIAGCVAAFLALRIGRVFSRLVTKVKYSYLCISIIALITILVFYFSSWIGLLVLFVSTAIGLIPSLVGVKKSLAMGCLLLPVILFFVL